MKATTLVFATCSLFGAAVAQVPDGYYAFCTFGSAGRQGVFFQHPRNPEAPIPVEGLNPDLMWNPNGRAGGACLLIRPADGALIVGERAAVGNSVDLHVMRLSGVNVVFDQLFSAGTAGPAGEIPQCGLLPDGRIVIAATDLIGGPLANVQTTSYNFEGVGIVDPIGGAVTAVPIANPSVFLSGVFNGLAVSPDGQTAYIANYVSTAVGEVWALPLPAGGNATLLASVTPVSNLGFDLDGKLLITTLNGPPNLWQYDFGTSTATPITTTNGPLNAIGLETVTGNFAIASANSGLPARSIFWMEPDGTHHLIYSPNFATISGIDVSPDPRSYGAATTGGAAHHFQLRPNPGGLPLVGSSSFSLTVEAPTPNTFDVGLMLLTLAPLSTPVPVLGVDIWVDLSTLVGSIVLPPIPTQTMPLPIPNDTSLAGAALYAQAVHVLQGGLFTATEGVKLTIL